MNRWTEASVLHAILDRARRGPLGCLGYRETRHVARAMLDAAERHLGSWRAALATAHARWPKDEALAAEARLYSTQTRRADEGERRRFQDARIAAGLSQRALGLLCTPTATASTVSNWEHAHHGVAIPGYAWRALALATGAGETAREG